jgi:hypothetical protein
MSIDIKAYIENARCPKKAWRMVHQPKPINDFDHQQHLQDYLGVKQAANDWLQAVDLGTVLTNKGIDQHSSIEMTKQLLNQQQPITIADACFAYDDWFCRIDLLEYTSEGLTINRVSSSTKVKDNDTVMLSVQCFILEQLGYKVKAAQVILINHGYLRMGDLELDKLFRRVDLSSSVFDEISLIKTNLCNLKTMLQGNEPQVSLGRHCNADYECEHKNDCFSCVPDDHILNLYNNRYLDQEIKEGIVHFSDLINSDFKNKLTACQKRQIEHYYQDQGTYINHPQLIEQLSMVKFPIYFLDFETISYAIPPWSDTKPYEQIPFQFSIHIIKDSSMQFEHHEFIQCDGKDPRAALARELCRIISKKGTVIAYNISFEMKVIRYLADVFPNLERHLMSMNRRMSDLMVIFKKGIVYHRDMRNSFSIKSVLPALFPHNPSLNYHDLDGVKNGAQAMSSYRELINLPLEDRNHKLQELLTYCALDTYGLMMIYAKLHDLSFNTEYLMALHQ